MLCANLRQFTTLSMKRAASLVASFFLLLSTVGVMEIILRMIPSPVQHPSIYETDDPTSLLGIEFVPGAREVQQTPCTSWTVTVNSLGWRDTERTIERVPGKARIAVLGDSFMEGVGVEDAELFTRQLEKILGPDVEVLNFGLSSLGTVQQEILYEHVVAAYKPDIVLLAFYMNDVSNNDPVLEGGPERATRLRYRNADGSLASYQASSSSTFYFRRILRIHSALFRLLKTTDRVIRSRFNAVSTPASASGLSLSLNHYSALGEPKNEDWRRGWEATERSLIALQSHLTSDQRFVLFVVPGVIDVADDPAALYRQEFRADPPAGFDVSYVRSRLHSFAKKHGIVTVDALPGFKQYITEHHLKYPFFSRTCDGHWSALGHKVAADVLLLQLQPILAEFR